MKIGILSRGKKTYATKRLASAAKEAGHSVTVIDPFDCYLHIRSKGYKIYHRSRGVDNLDVLIPRLSRVTAEYGLEVVYHFESAGVTVINKADAIANARSKFRSLRILHQHGIPVPPTFIAGSTNYLDRAIKRIGGYPLILKPLEGTQGKGIMLLETPLSISSLLEALWDLRQNPVVQRYISESEGQDVRAFVVGGRLVAAMQRTAKEGEFRSNIHLGGTGEMIELDAEYKDIALRAAKAMELEVVGVDMLETRKGPLVLEVNPSPGFEGLEEATELDIAKEIIEYAVKLRCG